MALDFGAPRRLWAVAGVAAVIALAFAGEMYFAEYRRDQLRPNGIRATGTVLEVIEPKFWNVIVNSAYIYRTVRLRITRSDGVAPYEHKMRGLYMFGNVPDEGDKFALRVDPGDPNHFIVVHESLSGDERPGGTRHTDWHVKGVPHQQPQHSNRSRRTSTRRGDGSASPDLGSALDKIVRAARVRSAHRRGVQPGQGEAAHLISPSATRRPSRRAPTPLRCPSWPAGP